MMEISEMGRPECIKGMKNIKIAMLVLVVCLSSVGFASAQVENDTKEKVVKTAPPPPKKDCPNEEACELWEEFRREYGSPSKVEWDRSENTLKRIWALNYDTGKGPVKTKVQAEGIARGFFEDTEDLWKFKTSDLKPTDIEYVNRTKEWIVNYQQYYAGIPVYGASAGATITEEGKIYSAGSGIYRDISVPTTPEITKEQAVEIAKREIEKTGRGISRTDYAINQSTLVIFPEKKNGLIEYHLTWHFTLQHNSFFIDVVSGEVVWQETLLRAFGPPETSSPKGFEYFGNYFIGIIVLVVIFTLIVAWRMKK